jgi:hypothetical protein
MTRGDFSHTVALPEMQVQQVAVACRLLVTAAVVLPCNTWATEAARSSLVTGGPIVISFTCHDSVCRLSWYAMHVCQHLKTAY